LGSFGILVALVGGLAAALVFGYLAIKLKFSPIVGYLLAGILIGPFTPGLHVDHHITEQFAEIGVLLMLFGIGLKFHLEELIAVWRIAVPGALIQSSLSTLAMATIMHFLGMSWIQGAILGVGICVASTVVMANVMAESHDLHSKIGHIAIGWTVVEDILTVMLLLLLPILFGPNAAGTDKALEAIGMAGLKMFGLVAVVVVLGKWVVPWILNRIANTRSRELFTLAVLVLAIGVAVGAAKLFGVSMELGAFLAGLAVGRSEFATRASGDAVPMRDAFSILFFVSVGMLFDPESLFKAPVTILVVLAVVLLIKPAIAVFTVRLHRKPWALAIPVGVAFAQVGEFSFILGSVALGLKLIDSNSFDAIVAASIISITINPSLYRYMRKFSQRLGRRSEDMPAVQGDMVDPDKCVLVGYGPVGQIVCRLLRERGADITVVDLNLETIRRLKAAGIKAIYGDVLRAGTLEDAGIATSGSLVLSADIEDGVEIVRKVRKMNPGIRILARCTHLRDAEALRLAGADVVAAGEAEVGVALAEEVTAGEDWDDMTAAEHREIIRRRLYDNPNGRFPTAVLNAENVNLEPGKTDV